MFILKIAVASVLLVLSPEVSCSGILAPHAAVPVPVAAPLRYRLVAPQNIRPFAAQVSTFSRGLNIYAAPYAAGVLSAPAIIPRAVVPGVPPVPGPLALPAALPAPVAYPGGLPAPVAQVPAVAPPAALPVPYPPAPFAPVATGYPGHFLPYPFARSVHAVAPGAVAPAIAPPPALLG